MNNIKLLYSLILLLFIITSCASVKNKYTPAGAWEYIVKDTPMGDSKGTLLITQTDGGFEGKMITDNFGEANLDNLSIVDNKLSASAFLSQAGVSVDINGLFEGDTFNGTVGVNGDEYTLTGTRQPSN